MKKKVKFTGLFYLLLFVGVILIAWYALKDTTETADLQYSELAQLFYDEKVKSFEVTKTNVVNVELKDGTTATYRLRDFAIFYEDLADTIQSQLKEGKIEKYEYEPLASTPWWVQLIPTILMIAIMAFLWIWLMNQMMGGRDGRIGAFGKSRATLTPDDSNSRKYFRDVAGADEEKAELAEIVDFLKNPTNYTKLGAKIPHGVLLMGPPGTGKTLLAKAVAGEAGVPFYSISGSDFVEMYVGVGASRVRDLFDTARKNKASIVFIDEIDAVSRHRGAGVGGGHDEREQTLNQLLVEMDGFGSNEGTIVIAATNRPDILDPALLRPGRFDRQITVNYPDIRGREDILKVHARGKPFEGTVDFKRIAQTTVGFTGADLANLLNESALLAARRNKNLIGMDEIQDSYMKIILGPNKKAKIRREKDRKLAAYHEAGHAVAGFLCPNSDPVRHITIVPTARTGGVTVRIPEEDAEGTTRSQMFEDIVISLGGRVAEDIIFGEISTGASSDIKHATSVARNMVTKYGMSDKLGPILYGSEHDSDEVFLGRDFSSGKGYSEQTAADIDEEIKTIISKAYEKCKELLTENSEKLKALAEYLLHAETCDGDQFTAIMTGEPTFEELDAMV
ncbi:MAG: ATP-dependent zinc metalloprotease FtsH, partial [Firmicutes bacterium]|nr:ATP-dependent zinc metalloprotease FtsH [Candidatus Colimorpha enterica]